MLKWQIDMQKSANDLILANKRIAELEAELAGYKDKVAKFESIVSHKDKQLALKDKVVQVLLERVCSGPCQHCPINDDFPNCIPTCFERNTEWATAKAKEG